LIRKAFHGLIGQLDNYRPAVQLCYEYLCFITLTAESKPFLIFCWKSRRVYSTRLFQFQSFSAVSPQQTNMWRLLNIILCCLICHQCLLVEESLSMRTKLDTKLLPYTSSSIVLCLENALHRSTQYSVISCFVLWQKRNSFAFVTMKRKKTSVHFNFLIALS
jgi:hypothetical protein